MSVIAERVFSVWLPACSVCLLWAEVWFQQPTSPKEELQLATVTSTTPFVRWRIHHVSSQCRIAILCVSCAKSQMFTKCWSLYFNMSSLLLDWWITGRITDKPPHLEPGSLLKASDFIFIYFMLFICTILEGKTFIGLKKRQKVLERSNKQTKTNKEIYKILQKLHNKNLNVLL